MSGAANNSLPSSAKRVLKGYILSTTAVHWPTGSLKMKPIPLTSTPRSISMKCERGGILIISVRHSHQPSTIQTMSGQRNKPGFHRPGCISQGTGMKVSAAINSYNIILALLHQTDVPCVHAPSRYAECVHFRRAWLYSEKRMGVPSPRACKNNNAAPCTGYPNGHVCDTLGSITCLRAIGGV